MKSVPISPAASVRSDRTRKVFVNSHPFSTKVTYFCPLISRTFQATPYGFIRVTLTLTLEVPRGNIDILEPVFNIRLLDTPSIPTETVGVSCSSRMGTLGFLTAFSGRLRWKELY